MENKFSFIPLSFSDLPLIHKWFNLPHIQKFYSLRQWTEAEVSEKLKPYITGDAPVSAFVILMNDAAIGYVQQYKVSDYPWANHNFPEEIVKTASGMDLFIGDKNLLRKGIGSQLIKAFIEMKIWPQFQYCIVDPDTTNFAAIKCYETLNFKSHAIIDAKNALNEPLQLNLMILNKGDL